MIELDHVAEKDRANSAAVDRRIVEISAFDGGKLRGTLFERAGHISSGRNKNPVLCLPGHTRSARDFHKLANYLLTLDDGPNKLLALDHRGRGLSDNRDDWVNYSTLSETEDAVSVCDALGWHLCDIIANSRGGFISMLLAVMRPGLQNSVILNDIGPELNGVGVARMRTVVERMPVPDSWDKGAALLRSVRGEKYPLLTDADWQDRALTTWKDDEGKPARDYDAGLLKSLQRLDFDQRLPTLWREFGALRNRPILLIQAENSDMLTDATVDRMQQINANMQIVEAYGQGHAPILHLGNIPEAIAGFLASVNQV